MMVSDGELVASGDLRAVNMQADARPGNPLPLGNIANSASGSPFPAYNGMELAGWGYLHLQ